MKSIICYFLLGLSFGTPSAFAIYDPTVPNKWQRIVQLFTSSIHSSEDEAKDDKLVEPTEQPSMTAIQTLESFLSEPQHPIPPDAKELDVSQKLAAYERFKEFDIEGVWVTNNLGHDSWKAVSFHFVKNGADILLMVDYWNRGNVMRLMEMPLEDLVDKSDGPIRIDLLEEHTETLDGNRYGKPNSPLRFVLMKLNPTVKSFFLFENGNEVLNLSMMRRWKDLKEEDQDDIATFNGPGITMSRFRRGAYPAPKTFAVCQRYLGQR